MLQDIYQPNPEFAKDARIKSMDEYNALVKKANDDYEGYISRRNLTEIGYGQNSVQDNFQGERSHNSKLAYSNMNIERV